MTLISIGDQVAGGTCRFHSRFNRAVNFTRAGRLVSVVTEDRPASSTRAMIAVLREHDPNNWEHPRRVEIKPEHMEEE
jgi:hypothetical protein